MDARCSHLRRGWYWGGQEFAEKLRRLSDKLLKERVTIEDTATGESKRFGRVKVVAGP